MLAMESLATIAGLLRHRHGLAAYCRHCRRWADITLGPLIVRGLGARQVSTLKPRCKRCGQPGELQVRPPMPRFSGATWMAERPAAAGLQGADA
jgi:hypothetical protein